MSKLIKGTLVLVASETSSREEIEDATKDLLKVHDGPVVVLPHNWTTIPIDVIRAQLDAIEKSPPTIGPSKPPPPPPPPA